MITKIITIFLSLSIINTTIAGTRDPNIPDRKYIEYGQKFTYVGKLCGIDSNGNKFCASAVAIDDNHILTAAHVVNNAESCYLYINNKKICIPKFIINKNFEGQFGTGDIAIGYCEEDIGLKFYPELYTSDDEVGKLCSIAGYGITGNFKTGSTLSDNKKRAGSNTIDNVYLNLLVCTPSKQTNKDYTELEFIIAPGDSGGGLFIDNKLAGINSCVMAIDRAPSSSYGDESCHTRISKFIEWIKENKNEKK
jgi:V8-like Glu-specific endopeptidase